MIIRISTLGNGMGEKHISTKELTTPFELCATFTVTWKG